MDAAKLFPRIERKRLVWRPAGAVKPFGLELEALFRPSGARYPVRRWCGRR